MADPGGAHVLIPENSLISIAGVQMPPPEAIIVGLTGAAGRDQKKRSCVESLDPGASGFEAGEGPGGRWGFQAIRSVR